MKVSFRGALGFWLVLLACTYDSAGQTSTTPYRYGQVFTTLSLPGILSWTTPGNAALSDNQRARAGITLAALSSAHSDYLVIKGFGFNIPAYASVTGIEVTIERRATGLGVGAGVRDNIVQLIRADTLTGANLRYTSNWPGSDQTVTYGSGSESWSTMWTAAEVNSPDFGIAVSVRLFSGVVALALAAEIDQVQIRIHYFEEVLPVFNLNFRGNPLKEHVQLHWTKPDAGLADMVLVERLDHQSRKWMTEDSVDLQGNDPADQRVQWVSSRTAEPVEYYRLSLLRSGWRVFHTKVIAIYSAKVQDIKIYPNPARNIIQVTSGIPFGELRLFDVTGNVVLSRRWSNLQTKQSVDLSALPPGCYFLSLPNVPGEHFSRVFILR